MFDKKFTNNLQQLKLVVLTGAGISAESGLKTFRDNDGLWENHSVQQVATPEAFAADPDLVYRFYQQRRQQLKDPHLKPNQAHLALMKLEQRMGENFTLITQNVDDLHERAGNKNVLHMHGSLLTARCLVSEQVFNLEGVLDKQAKCPCCQPPNSIRPDIVWFGEIPKYMAQIEQKLTEADLFVSIGTSGTVYPAAGFVALANQSGAYSVELNMQPSLAKNVFDQGIYGPATQVVNEFVDDLLHRELI